MRTFLQGFNNLRVALLAACCLDCLSGLPQPKVKPMQCFLGGSANKDFESKFGAIVESFYN